MRGLWLVVGACLAGHVPCPAATTPDEVRTEIGESVAGCATGDAERYRVEFTASAVALDIASGETVESIDTGDRPCRPGRREALVRIRSVRGVRVVRAGYRVVREVWAPVLTRDVPRGHRVNATDVRWAWWDATRYGDEAPAIDGSLALRRRAREGELLTKRLVKAPLAVSRGDVVLVVVRRSGLMVRAEGVAERDGRLGDRIRVRNTASGESFEATVVGTKEVEL